MLKTLRFTIFKTICSLFLFTSYTFVQAQDLSNLPLYQIEDLSYTGAFRIPADEYGNSNINYSQGPITFNPDNNSLFIVGHAHEQAIAEFAIPEIIQSESLSDLKFSPEPLQYFRSFLDTTPDGNSQGLDRIGGLQYVKEESQAKLIVNAYEYYDAPGDNTLTTLIINDATDLASSSTQGYKQFKGGAGHTAGWISPVPSDLVADLNGDFITGFSSGRPIISRLSVGPSAFAFSMETFLQEDAEIITTKLLDFSLANPLHEDLSNASLDNDIWTHLSSAAYGFIVPGTRSYLTVGKSGGHESGVCYKCTQDTGNLCGGYCSPVDADNYNYYWLWDVQDLIAVKNGAAAAHSIRPYAYGVFNTPFQDVNEGIGGGSFDPNTGNLYLTIQKGDTDQGTYARPPVVVVYNVGENLSISEDVEAAPIQFFPNPTQGALTFSNLEIGASISITNIVGQTMLSFTAASETLEIDISTFSAGIYFAKCSKAEQERVFRIVKK